MRKLYILVVAGHLKIEPMTRIELVTPSLPRKYSTTELQRLNFIYANKNESDIPNSFFWSFERKTGLEPATYSLEGYRSTKWATSAYIII